MAYFSSSLNLTSPGRPAQGSFLSYPESMGSTPSQLSGSPDINLDFVLSQDLPQFQVEDISLECIYTLSEDDTVLQYPPSTDLGENHIDSQSTLDGCYRSSILKNMQEEHELAQPTINPQLIPIYSTATEQTPFSPHVFTHSAAPGSNGLPSAVPHYRLSSSTDASSPFLCSSDAEPATLPNGILRGYHAFRGISSSPSISRTHEVKNASPSNGRVAPLFPSPLSSPTSSSLQPTSPFLDITNFYSSPSENSYDRFFEVMFAQPCFSPVLRASALPSGPEYHSLDATMPSPPQVSDALAERLLATRSQTRQPSTPEKKKNLTNSICERIDALFSPFVLRTPEQSLNSEPSTLSSPMSPLTPLTDDGRLALPLLKNSKPVSHSAFVSSSYGRLDQRRKRRALGSPTPSHSTKRARPNSQVTSRGRPTLTSSLEMSSPEHPLLVTVSKHTATSISGGPQGEFLFNQRTFPRHTVGQDLERKGAILGLIEVSDEFPLFYRRFPASSYFKPQENVSECTLFKLPHPGGMYNRPRHAFDLYTPRFVKGKGKEKMGLCPICVESTERGGEGKKVWLAMKFSAYKCYHMQYSHGISASSSLPFSPPVAFRTVRRTSAQKTEKTMIKEGKCHKCSKWVPVEGIKDIEVKVKELFWWKHAAACHSSSTLEGETDVFEEDEVFHKLKALDTSKGV